MKKGRIILTTALIAAMSIQIVGCNKADENVSESAKVFRGTVVEADDEKCVIQPEESARESVIANKFTIEFDTIKDKSTKELLPTLKPKNEREKYDVIIYYKDVLNIGSAAKINHVYRAEKVNVNGTYGYGNTATAPRSIMVGGEIYTDTGIITDEEHGESANGKIGSSVEEGTLPTKDNEANFGSGYEYWTATKTSLHVNLDGKMTVFKQNNTVLAKEKVLNIYVDTSSSGNLNVRTTKVEALNEDIIMRELRNMTVLTDNVILKSFEDNGDSLMLDFNKELTNHIYQYGANGKNGVFGAIVNTFLDAYGANEIIITVNGSEFEVNGETYEGAQTWFGEKEETEK